MVRIPSYTTLRMAVGHPAAAGVVLAGSAFAFTFHPGGLGDWMAAGGILFGLNLLAGNYRVRDASGGTIAALGIVAAILIIHLIAPGGQTHARSFKYFLLFPGMMMLGVLFTGRVGGRRGAVALGLGATVLCACVTIQTIGHWVNRGQELYGFYGAQRHHLGLFASLALPPIVWLATRFRGWRGGLFLPWAAAALFLLWGSHSRVSWIVFFPAVILSALLFLERRQAVGLLAATLVMAALALWVAGAGEVGWRLQQLVADFGEQGRFAIWRETWATLERNTPLEWLLGHGIGSFAFDANVHISPHNAFLQMLFENGILGTALTAGGYLGLMVGLRRAAGRRGRTASHLPLMLFTLLAILAGHCLLTKSIYSRYILYSLSLVVGASLAVIAGSRRGPLTAEVPAGGRNPVEKAAAVEFEDSPSSTREAEP